MSGRSGIRQAEQLASLEAGCARLFIVTTGSGPGSHAHKLWQASALGKGAFATIFLPWMCTRPRRRGSYEEHVEQAVDVRR